MSVVSITGATVNAALIVSLEWDHRHYVNGTESTLVITFVGGGTRRVRHGQGCNAFALERELYAAMAAARR